MDYEGLSREALIERLQALEKQLKSSRADSILASETANVRLVDENKPTNAETSIDNGDAPEQSRKRNKEGRKFDFSKFPQRKIALKFSYFGWSYHGLARQGNALGSGEKREIENQFPTIEGELFKALANCKLITSESECDYSRCGRTDRGVSAFGQVVAMYVRSAGKYISEDEAADIESKGDGDIIRDEQNEGKPVLLPSIESELPYVNMLNKCLPPEIRVFAWAPVKSAFSARFSCKSRFYRYFFSKNGLDIEAMRDAASRYLGTHDFRNFCRLDPAKQITNFERTVLDIAINPVPSQVPFVGNGTCPEGRWWQLELRGSAFLWHQVRCMMAILFLVGQGLEQPGIVDNLIDVQNLNGKPEYEMASDTPLVLADCLFDEVDAKWIYVRGPGQEATSMSTLDRSILRQWGYLNTQAVVASALLQNLRATIIPVPETLKNSNSSGGQVEWDQWANCRARLAQLEQREGKQFALGGGLSKTVRNYVPVLERRRADPVELRNQAWMERKGSRKRTKLTHSSTEAE
ncbi:pseudouridine synthase deg1 [Coemansia spiralis]|uniref:Pseudouridine synthase deg1 n=2 Tax=Coemansia TaxID=4863 RepID=A0A9W8KVU3_9FUNG|nr:pseudouridine synthase deg1 [Coemansia sp. RSA 1358]KAJ2670697.1 pseudouridine synthase deg1 [Coemansia spiralis]